MPEQIQQLIDRIHEEGFAEAEKRAGEIVRGAREEASRLIEEARAETERVRAEARHAIAVEREQARVALEQAARDMIHRVRILLQEMMEVLVRHKVSEAMTPDWVARLAAEAVGTYLKEGTSGEAVVWLNEASASAWKTRVMSEVAERLDAGVKLVVDGGMGHGFRLSMDAGRSVHDFGEHAVAEALASMVRGELAHVVRSVVRGKREETGAMKKDLTQSGEIE